MYVQCTYINMYVHIYVCTVDTESLKCGLSSQIYAVNSSMLAVPCFYTIYYRYN